MPTYKVILEITQEEHLIVEAKDELDAISYVKSNINDLMGSLHDIKQTFKSIEKLS